MECAIVFASGRETVLAEALHIGAQSYSVLQSWGCRKLCCKSVVLTNQSTHTHTHVGTHGSHLKNRDRACIRKESQ